MRALLVLLALTLPAWGRDDGRYENSPHKQWFDSQHNSRGQSCCLESDAHAYDGNYTLNPDGSVTIGGGATARTLPEYMVLQGINPTGRAIWWYLEIGGSHYDYCFSPGTMG